jgi:hypothetical protein
VIIMRTTKEIDGSRMGKQSYSWKMKMCQSFQNVGVQNLPNVLWWMLIPDVDKNEDAIQTTMKLLVKGCNIPLIKHMNMVVHY